MSVHTASIGTDSTPSQRTAAACANRYRDQLLGLPQPLLVLGSMAAVALAHTHQWIDPDLFGLIMAIAPLPLVLIAERIWVKRPDWQLSPKEFLEDAFWLGTAGLIWVPLYFDYYRTPISDGFRAVRDSTPLNFELAPASTLGIVFAAILLRTLSEFVYYWLHRAQHESLFWWRIHATHHHITKMGAARGDRTHPLEFMALFIGTPVALALTGASDAVIAVAGAFGFFSAYLNHCNLPLKSGWYGLYFTTAEQHQLHHANDMKYSNTNYGCTIIIWDRIFGTFTDGSQADKILSIGAGTGQPLSILDQYKIAFVSNDKLTKY